ncbi:MAG: CRISPR-associated endonuclease Cas1, partial [Desulfomonilaceae bacterium]|nr:CRISPR-associated endonuclease Cas1 [Desulfomonilaceae bacterium]
MITKKMAILYVTDQGAAVFKEGNRLLIKKQGNVIQWVHAFDLDQVVLMGNISLSPGAVAYLLQ